jgi:hypothetical protein
VSSAVSSAVTASFSYEIYHILLKCVLILCVAYFSMQKSHTQFYFPVWINWSVKGTRISKSLAQRSHKIVLFCMDQFVFCKITRCGKFLVANITHIFLSFCMDQLVSSQSMRLSKSLVTNITHMVFSVCMEQLVFFQVTSLSKSLAALSQT